MAQTARHGRGLTLGYVTVLQLGSFRNSEGILSPVLHTTRDCPSIRGKTNLERVTDEFPELYALRPCLRCPA